MLNTAKSDILPLYELAVNIPERGGIMKQIYGYVRVSSREQNEDRQLSAMRDFGIQNGNIYLDKQSGKDFNRPAYLRLLKNLKRGDTIVVKSIDRLGRNYGEILEQWRIITKEKRVAIVVLDIPLLDTRQKNHDLTSTFIADLVLQILSYVAQTERELIKQRQAEGITAAKSRGVKFGRPPMERSGLFWTLRASWESKEISAREAARRLGVNHRTFLAWMK